jgi:hypothetical protein
MVELNVKLLAASLGWFSRESRYNKQRIGRIRVRVVLSIVILLGYLLAVIVMAIRSS